MKARIPGIWLAVILLSLCGCARQSTDVRSALERWLGTAPMYIAHRGGDADWPESTAFAYAHAAAWNPDLALEVPVRRTVDGIWVVSEPDSTKKLFGPDYSIAKTPWTTLSTLRTKDGGRPMARLVEDILTPYAGHRVLFIDDKSDSDVIDLFDTLARNGADPRSVVIKAYGLTKNAVTEAHLRGYLTWGYYQDTDMAAFASTNQKFDMVGINSSAPAADFRILADTNKPIISNGVDDNGSAQAALAKGARGLVVSDVEAIVPQDSAGR